MAKLLPPHKRYYRYIAPGIHFSKEEWEALSKEDHLKYQKMKKARTKAYKELREAQALVPKKRYEPTGPMVPQHGYTNDLEYEANKLLQKSYEHRAEMRHRRDQDSARRELMSHGYRVDSWRLKAYPRQDEEAKEDCLPPERLEAEDRRHG